MTGFRAAVSLLTRAPLGAGALGAGELSRAVPWFPVVGALVGLAVAGAYAGLLLVLPPIPAAGAALGLGILATGAIHEDGLADTADAVGGAGTREDALRIMRDPAHGTYGVLAIVLGVVLRVGALSSLDAWAAVAVLTGAHGLSRGAAVGLLGAVRPAADDGLGALYANATTRRGIAVGIGAALAVGLIALGGWALPAALLAASAAAAGALAARRIGGITGDVLGAAQQVAETLVLLLGAAAVVGGWPSPAWWR